VVFDNSGVVYGMSMFNGSYINFRNNRAIPFSMFSLFCIELSNLIFVILDDNNSNG